MQTKIAAKEESFKPYKGVSSNWFLKIGRLILEGFKPYKGVSSNF